MDLNIKSRFTGKWKTYFAGCELPIACYSGDDPNGATFPEAPEPERHDLACIFSQLAPVRRGKPRAFNPDNPGCWGSKGLLGFIPAQADEPTTDFPVNVDLNTPVREKHSQPFQACGEVKDRHPAKALHNSPKSVPPPMPGVGRNMRVHRPIP